MSTSNLISALVCPLLAVVCLGSSPDAHAEDGAKKDKAKERFEQLDADGDGALSRKEFLADHEGKDKAKRALRFKKMDRDGDGQVSKKEWRAAAKKRKGE